MEFNERRMRRRERFRSRKKKWIVEMRFFERRRWGGMFKWEFNNIGKRRVGRVRWGEDVDRDKG
uniref:hypothetical protein n=1 Tax=Neisseria sicca TaxID=490 RepID=UPI0011BD08AB